jgi:hypothetical protein
MPTLLLGKVTTKGRADRAVRPDVPRVTEIGSKEAPTGTATVSWVVDAADTEALVSPKYTTLPEGLALKFVPLIVTFVPTAPLAGVKEVIAGTPKSRFPVSGPAVR